MRTFVLVAAIAAAVGMAGPATAEPKHEPPVGSPGELAIDGFHKLMEALQLYLGALPGYIEALPRYEPPVMTEDGDIIIRRKREPEGPPPYRYPRPGLPDITTITI